MGNVVSQSIAVVNRWTYSRIGNILKLTKSLLSEFPDFNSSEFDST